MRGRPSERRLGAVGVCELEPAALLLTDPLDLSLGTDLSSFIASRVGGDLRERDDAAFGWRTGRRSRHGGFGLGFGLCGTMPRPGSGRRRLASRRRRSTHAVVTTNAAILCSITPLRPPFLRALPAVFFDGFRPSWSFTHSIACWSLRRSELQPAHGSGVTICMALDLSRPVPQSGAHRQRARQAV